MNAKILSELEVAVLGAGAVGRALAIELLRGEGGESCPCVRLWSRDGSHAEELCETLASGCRGARDRVRSVPDLKEALAGADLVLFCVVDDALESLAETCAENSCDPELGAVALHVSGFASLGVLDPLARRGWSVGSLHPLVSLPARDTFSAKVRQARSPFEGAYLALAGDAAALHRGRELAQALGGSVLELESGASARALYHAAASFLSGGVAVIFDRAEGLLRRAVKGSAIDRRRALASLLRSTANHLAAEPASQVLTGPVARGDRDTIAGHLSALEELASKPHADGPNTLETQALYRQLSLSMVELMRRRGWLDPDVLDQIASLLSDGTQTD